MNKPTSKSVSATRKPSSQSGMSAKTVAMASKPESKFGFILARAKKKTPEQARQALVRAGIITDAGKLTAHYKTKTKTKKKTVNV